MISKKEISIIGLGFIGFPLFSLLNNKLNSKVIGIDKKNLLIKNKFLQIQKGINPIKCNDEIFNKIVKKNSRKKLYLSTDLSAIKNSKIVIVSIGFDLSKKNSMHNLKKLFEKIGQIINEHTLVVLETTVLPGTSKNIILPILKKEIIKRKLDFDKIYFSYSFERIMPGKNYIESLNSDRCFSSKDIKSKNITLNFLKLFINIKKNRITYFDSFIDCESAKIIENSYRALNIAFIDEWVKFGIINNLDIKKILSAIRLRNTHSNIMRPGIGVGGYCLTKDLLFGNLSNIYFKKKLNKFPLTLKAKMINQKMFETSFNFIKANVKLKNKKILILGASYKADVFDIRLSPSIDLINNLKKYSNKVFLYDPFLEKNEKENFINKLCELKKFEVVIFVNSHQQIKNIPFKKFKKNTIFFDLNNVLSDTKIQQLKKKIFY